MNPPRKYAPERWVAGAMTPEYHVTNEPTGSLELAPGLVLEWHMCDVRLIGMADGTRDVFACCLTWSDGVRCGASWYDLPPSSPKVRRTWWRQDGGQ